VIPAEEMTAVSQSVHHEGLCILAREVAPIDFNTMVKSISQEESTCLVYLDGVQNPHNIGSIMRLCAHFGVRFILVAKSHYTKISPSAYRVAQGGAEYVQVVPVESFSQAYDILKKKGFQAVASSSHKGKSLYEHRFCKKTLIVMGAETEGISKETLAHIQETLLIPGTDWVESLNVSVATALFLSEFWRQVGKR
jgi:TrmH RNA methyltransferase